MSTETSADRLTEHSTLTDVIVAHLMDEYGEDDATWRDMRSAQRIAQAVRARIESEPRIARALAAQDAAGGIHAPGDTSAGRDALAEALRSVFRGDEYEENAMGAASEGEWSWFGWLASTAGVDAVLAALAARPAPDTLAARVRALHVRRDTPVYDDMECAERSCGHPEGTCVVVAPAVCAHCADQTEPDEPWEHMVRETAYWPCSTIKLLDDALLAGRPDASPEDTLAEHRRAWADYIEHHDGWVGATPLTAQRIVELLRGEHPPFGKAAGPWVPVDRGAAEHEERP